MSPYIPKEDRDALEQDHLPDSPGELTYVIFKACIDYLYTDRKDLPRYQQYAEVMGAIEAAKMELYRTDIAPYEDQKRYENGSVVASYPTQACDDRHDVEPEPERSDTVCSDDETQREDVAHVLTNSPYIVEVSGGVIWLFNKRDKESRMTSPEPALG